MHRCASTTFLGASMSGPVGLTAPPVPAEEPDPIDRTREADGGDEPSREAYASYIGYAETVTPAKVIAADRG